MNKRTLALFAFGVLILVLAACRGGARTPRDVTIPFQTPTTVPQTCENAQYPEDAPQFGDDSAVEYETTPSGLQYFDRVVGDGDQPTEEDRVLVNYTGFLEDGCIFDTTRIYDRPAFFRLGGVIAGWREGLGTMREGGQRRLRIPPELAYGDRGFPGRIPPNSTLIFEVELVEVRPPATSTPASAATSTPPSATSTSP